MGLDIKYLGETPGILKIISVVLGIILIAVTGHGYNAAYFHGPRPSGCADPKGNPCPHMWPAVTSLVIIISAWLLSSASLLASVVRAFKVPREIDALIYLVGGIGLVVTSALTLYYAITAVSFDCNEYYKRHYDWINSLKRVNAWDPYTTERLYAGPECMKQATFRHGHFFAAGGISGATAVIYFLTIIATLKKRASEEGTGEQTPLSTRQKSRP